MVSYYREFTFHHKNRLDFREYVELCHAMFDQHLMVQSFQAMLDGRLTLISFDKHDDIFPVYCKAAGIAEAIGTAVVERGNVKSADALDVEALRLARVLGLPPERLPEVLPEFREKHDGKDALWTERYPDDIPATSAKSEARFCQNLRVVPLRRCSAFSRRTPERPLCGRGWRRSDRFPAAQSQMRSAAGLAPDPAAIPAQGFRL